ncbi:MAG: RuvX/YqgF family protein, partial [Clostridiales bacterium]|nr:RuvX/YqgF family protein [Clostridiales bacterium]
MKKAANYTTRWTESKMKRKIGLDIGDVRIGVAVSDLMGVVANARETYVRKNEA